MTPSVNGHGGNGKGNGKPHRLTGKQQKFVEHYCGAAQGNAVMAARLAGYATPHPEGCRLLQNATIRSAIDARLEPLILSTNEILERVSALARADIGNLSDLIEWKMGAKGHMRVEVDLKRARARGVSKTIKRVSLTGIELHDPTQALALLAKLKGIDRPAPPGPAPEDAPDPAAALAEFGMILDRLAPPPPADGPQEPPGAPPAPEATILPPEPADTPGTILGPPESIPAPAPAPAPETPPDPAPADPATLDRLRDLFGGGPR